MNNIKCHLCKGKLSELGGFPSFFQVTSDCRPWNSGGHLAVCQDCGAVQKPVTENWLREAGQIYANYQIYSQSKGAEQSTFDQITGASESRSQKIVQWLATHHNLPKTGKLLDFGCGNGAFLKAFGNSFPEWRMAGLELDSRNKQAIESIPGVDALYFGKLENLKDRFNLIVLVHALEHIQDPVPFIKSLGKTLKPGGLLLIEVPDLRTSPFDILVADHCTHFTEDALKRVLGAGGFKTVAITSDYVPKEISLLSEFVSEDASKEISSSSRRKMFKERNCGEALKAAKANIAWLQDFLQKAMDVTGNIGIFGTSISATWLAASLGEKVSFFVDEDVNRIGRIHMNRPILDPSSAPPDSKILLPMRSDIAAAIAKRLTSLNCKFILQE